MISPRIWFVGIPLLAALFFWIPSPMLVLIAVLALPRLWGALKDRSLVDSPYYRVAPGVRLEYSVQYLGLASLLAIMSFEAHRAIGA